MSTDSLDKPKVKEFYENMVQELLKDPENAKCADCGAKGPRWASHNLGVFLCIRCGGLHRKLGTHISKVKSITLDSWRADQAKSMQEWGNVKANAFYLPRPELVDVPTHSDSDMELFIRDKYEKQCFRNPDKLKSKFYKESLEASEAKYNKELLKLKEMGFNNTSLCIKALKQFDKNVADAAEWLCNIPDATTKEQPVQKSNQQSQPNTDQLPPQFNPQRRTSKQMPAQNQPAKTDLFILAMGSGGTNEPSLATQNDRHVRHQQQQPPHQANVDLFSMMQEPQELHQQQQQQSGTQKQVSVGEKGAFGDLTDAFSSAGNETAQKNKKDQILSLFSQQQQQQLPFQQQQQQANPFSNNQMMMQPGYFQQPQQQMFSQTPFSVQNPQQQQFAAYPNQMGANFGGGNGMMMPRNAPAPFQQQQYQQQPYQQQQYQQQPAFQQQQQQQQANTFAQQMQPQQMQIQPQQTQQQQNLFF